MRARDVCAALKDALDAGTAIERRVQGLTLEDYAADEILTDAVERRFEVLGEALNRALRTDPSLVERIPEARDVVGFRNVLAHGYDVVSNATVFGNAKELLPTLMVTLRQLIDDPAGLS
jgi:uncharacterized protein with HEPN domain